AGTAVSVDARARAARRFRRRRVLHERPRSRALAGGRGTARRRGDTGTRKSRGSGGARNRRSSGSIQRAEGDLADGRRRGADGGRAPAAARRRRAGDAGTASTGRVATPSTAAHGAVRGRLVVQSTPSRAAVTIDGKWRGRTPLTLDDLPFGTYVVRVVQPGY